MTIGGRCWVRNGTRGRVEVALDRELLDRPDIGSAERAALRAQAGAVDLSERTRDSHMVSEASRVYLDLRQAAGLTSGGAPVADSFAQLLAELGRPAPGVRNTQD